MAETAAIYRVFVEKRDGFDMEARNLRHELAAFLGGTYPEIAALSALRILHRYDVAGLTAAQFEDSCRTVFAEPQCDRWYIQADAPVSGSESLLAVEYLGGQYDQRADSAEQCVELVCGVRPRVRTARVYVFTTAKPLSPAARTALAAYLINPVDSREAALALPASLADEAHEVPGVPILNGFRQAGTQVLQQMARQYGLAMSVADLEFCQAHFVAEGRDPGLAELRVLDTYWSDHCRHTTFTTELTDIQVADGRDAPALKKVLKLYEDLRLEVYGAEKAAKRPRTLMDIATIGGKALRKRGQLEDLEVSEEINACSIEVQAQFADGSSEPWLLMFKNETHNHPTEIEPFGGAATCLGGAIRDPLSGRSYVHQAMRVTGGADPRTPMELTLPGKLPQLKIARDAAHGYSSYGNQIGLATGQVAEFYHDGFLAKRMELGAVIAAVPKAWVRREEPAPGDVIILLGGKTGRDGIGGATGSSKEHTDQSVETAGAEVQKGNAVEERKIQRLFRKSEVCGLIKRCNDFGAGGVSVAVGELARGLNINLDAVPKKYEGLDGVELAISESQERMAVVVQAEDAARFIALAAEENLLAVKIADVTAEERLQMRWRGSLVVDLDRGFLDSNGASRSTKALIENGALDSSAYLSPRPEDGNGQRDPAACKPAAAAKSSGSSSDAGAEPWPLPTPEALLDRVEAELRSLRSASRRGLQEMFDGSIGAGSVLFPFGGATQGTPECGMAALLPSLEKDSRTASLMSFGYDPELASRSPFLGARAAILEALARFVSLGGELSSARLSLQEYFQRMDSDAAWGKPLAALLAALEAQLETGCAAIGGKDSMSGTYRDPSNGHELTVPPTLVAFAAGTTAADKVRSSALSGAAGNPIALIPIAEQGEPWDSFRKAAALVYALNDAGLVKAARAVSSGGVCADLAVMAFGNNHGLELDTDLLAAAMSRGAGAGSFLLELDSSFLNACPDRLEGPLKECGFMHIIACSIAEPVFRAQSPSMVDPERADTPTYSDGRANPRGMSAEVPLSRLRQAFEYPLAQVYHQTSSGHSVAEQDIPGAAVPAISQYTKGLAIRAESRASFNIGKGENAKPLVVLPAFPGTNCEWDMERAFRAAGARTQVLVFRNRDAAEAKESCNAIAAALKGAQILALSGGFSAGDEPEGSGKFIANALRAPVLSAAVSDLLTKRDGLALGICNGFQALIKLGLIPYGEYRDADATMPTLTFNTLSRHISRMVSTRVMSNQSPWLALDEVGAQHRIPISHGEGRIALSDELADQLFARGQVSFCYVDEAGQPTMQEPHNPNGSAFAIEGLSSPDGRVLGKMGHSERAGEYVHINIPGSKEQHIFTAGVRWFS